MRSTNHSTTPVFPNGGWKCSKCNAEFAYIFRRCGYCPREGQEPGLPLQERVINCLRHAVTLAKQEQTTSIPKLRKLLTNNGYTDEVIDGVLNMWIAHAATRTGTAAV